MSSKAKCLCCLLRPPDKDLKTSYKMLGKTEIYADMLKECFEIHIHHNNTSDGGICEVCITRLRDACDFKSQVQLCQKNLQDTLIKDEPTLKVKEEVADPDDENEIYFLELKEEFSDFDEDKEHDGLLVERLNTRDLTVKKRPLSKKKNGKKPSLLEKGDDLNTKKLLNGPLKLSLRAFAEMEKMTHKMEKIKKKIDKNCVVVDRRTKKVDKNCVVVDRRMVNDSNKHNMNLQNVIKYSNCTPFLNKTLSGYICAYCKETFSNFDALRSHVRSLHKNEDIDSVKRKDRNNLSIKMDITDLKCNVCEAKLDIIENLKKHLTKEHDVKFFPDVKDYILEFKLTDNEVLNCALCHATYETFKMLLQHMNGHYRNYVCDVCNLGFINKHRLKNHQRTHDVGSFKCSYCEKVFTTRIRKACHEKYTHNTSARYTTNCPQCEQSFTSYYQRNRHMFKEHNTVAATYKCNICDKSFIMKSKLTSHIKKVHLMERNHICPECGQGFFIKQSLDEHMIKHNGERVFKCTVCHKAYARKKTLREHMRIHNNDRRFKCDVCGTAFVQKCSLKSHMLSNHGITLSEYETARSSMDIPDVG